MKFIVLLFVTSLPRPGMGYFSDLFLHALEAIDYGLLLDQAVNPTLVLSSSDIEKDVDISSVVETAKANMVLVDHQPIEQNITADLHAWKLLDLVQKLDTVNACNHRTGYIKDPKRHYIIDGTSKNLNDIKDILFSDKVLSKLPCLIPRQPFVYILTLDGHV